MNYELIISICFHILYYPFKLQLTGFLLAHAGVHVTNISWCSCMCACLSIHVLMHVCVYVHVIMHVCVYVFLHVSMYIDTCKNMFLWVSNS